jgi:hypothetical protein
MTQAHSDDLTRTQGEGGYLEKVALPTLLL